MRLLTAAPALTICACSPNTDCRQASAACAEGFICVEGTTAWTCRPSTPEAETKTAAAPATAPEPERAVQAPPRELTKAERKRLIGEATLNIRKLFDSSVSYYNMEWSGRSGEVLPRQFPYTTLLTPPFPPRCVDGRPVPYRPGDSDWNAPTWQGLNFAIDEPHYYRYEYISTGTGPNATFTARALGDLDCDGILSTFERVGRIDDENNVTGGVGLFMANEFE